MSAVLTHPEITPRRASSTRLRLRHCSCENRQRAPPEQYAASLETGLWPTSDVLPLKEVHDRGVALEPGSAFWSRPPPVEGTVLLRKRSPVCTQHWPRSDRDTVPKLQLGKASSAPIVALPNRGKR